MAGVGFSPSGSVVLTPGHVLQITENGTTYSLQLNSSISSFQLAPDGNVGTDIFVGPVTSISTGHSSAGAVAAGSFQDVYGSANGTVISAGGSQFVYAGGVASGVTIGAFTGFQGIFSGGIASRTTDNGAQFVYSGALAVSTTMSNSEQDIFSGGTAINIFGNDSQQNIFFGGLAVNATFTSDSTQDVFGVASNTTLSASTQEVESGGTAIGTLVLLGDDFGFPTSGQQSVQGVAISTTVGNSGTLELDFGTAINTVVGSGGGLFGDGTLAGSLLDNGVVSFDAVGNTSFTLSGSGTFEIDGGEAVVDATGFTGSVTVAFATLQLVGGALAGSRPIAIGQDGTLELAGPGVAGSRPISLVDTGAVVRIDGTSMPTNTISGFSASDVIDLVCRRHRERHNHREQRPAGCPRHRSEHCPQWL
jgi:autotransporter passenger strand-loop-strand repeat protein